MKGGKKEKERGRQNLEGDGESEMDEEGEKALHWSQGANVPDWSKRAPIRLCMIRVWT